MSLYDIIRKKLAAQSNMIAAFGTAAHAEWRRIVREYEQMEKTLSAATVSAQR